MKRSLLIIVILVAVTGAIGYRVAVFQNLQAPTGNLNNFGSFDKKQYSLSSPASIWVVINKDRALPDGYNPTKLTVPNVSLRSGSQAEESQLEEQTAKALEIMFNAASKDGHKLMLVSGFRSQGLQSIIYNRHVAQLGEKEANRVSAKPRHSEHQTGFAADIGAQSGECQIQACFGETEEGIWLVKNAHKYGFIIRYRDGKEPVTGYSYEPWHFRYVGVDLATELTSQKIKSLEEFFGL